MVLDWPRPYLNFTDPRLDAPYVDNVVGWAADLGLVSSGQAGAHWVTMDIGSVRAVHGVVTQGGTDVDWRGVWTTSFWVQVSDDDVSWTGVDGFTTFGAAFAGNVDKDAHMVNDFASVVHARYVKRASSLLTTY